MENDRYLSLSELPYIKQLARMMYINSLSGGYDRPNNQLIEMIRNGNLDRYYNNIWRF